MDRPTSGKWNFHGMLSNDGAFEADKPIIPMTRKGEGAMGRALDRMAQMPKSEWGRPKASPLKDNKYVIRFKDENSTERRLFGHFYDAHCAFVLTFAGHEKNNQYYPTDYLERCTARKLDCDSGFSLRTSSFYGRCSLCKHDPKHQISAIPS